MSRKKQLPAKVEAQVVDLIERLSLDESGQALARDLQVWYNKLHEINSYAEFRRYYVMLMNAVRLGLVDRSNANAQVYAGSIILLGLDREREFGDPAAQLPEHMRDGLLQISMSKEEMRTYLQQTSQAVQITMLKKADAEGRVVAQVETSDGEVSQITDVEPVSDMSTFDDRAQELMEMIEGKKDGNEEWEF